MRALSGAAWLEIWERGQGQHTVDRALTILAVAFPERSLAELATLSVGARDALLLDVYEHAFGAQLEALGDCPSCEEKLELPFRVRDIRALPPAPLAPAYQMQVDGYELRFRLPNSIDLATVVQQAGSQPDVGAARALLLQRCLLAAYYEGQAVAVHDLPAAVGVALAARMEACDPQAEVRLQVVCPACGHTWQALFDIVPFLWAKILAQARALLRDVHTLARAYGWREADILSMSTVRRQYYLDLLA
jgi:hypothetical protein